MFTKFDLKNKECKDFILEDLRKNKASVLHTVSPADLLELRQAAKAARQQEVDRIFTELQSALKELDPPIIVNSPSDLREGSPVRKQIENINKALGDEMARKTSPGLQKRQSKLIEINQLINNQLNPEVRDLAELDKMSNQDLKEHVLSMFQMQLQSSNYEVFPPDQSKLICEMAGFSFNDKGEIDLTPRSHKDFDKKLEKHTHGLIYNDNNKKDELTARRIEAVSNFKKLDGNTKLGKFLLRASVKEIAGMLNECDQDMLHDSMDDNVLWNSVDPKIYQKLIEARKIADRQKRAEAKQKNKRPNLIKKLQSMNPKRKKLANEFEDFLIDSKSVASSQKNSEKWLKRDVSLEVFQKVAETIIQGTMVYDYPDLSTKQRVQMQEEAAYQSLKKELRMSYISVNEKELRKISKKIVSEYNREVFDAAKSRGEPITMSKLMEGRSESSMVQSFEDSKTERKGSAKSLKDLIDRQIEQSKSSKKSKDTWAAKLKRKFSKPAAMAR